MFSRRRNRIKKQKWPRESQKYMGKKEKVADTELRRFLSSVPPLMKLTVVAQRVTMLNVVNHSFTQNSFSHALFPGSETLLFFLVGISQLLASSACFMLPSSECQDISVLGIRNSGTSWLHKEYSSTVDIPIYRTIYLFYVSVDTCTKWREDREGICY